MPIETNSKTVLAHGFSRREFVRFASIFAAASALPITERALAQLPTPHRVPPPDAVLLNLNENPMSPAPEALEAIYASSKIGGRYQDKQHALLKTTLATVERLKPEYVTVFPGSSDALLRVVPAYTSPDKAYVAADPTFEAGARAATRTGQTGRALVGQDENYGENTADKSIANSNYNALETTVRYQHNGSQFLLSYTYAKSIDQGSNLGEQLNPINSRRSRAISAWDMKHDFAGTYTWALPAAAVLRRAGRWTDQWSVSGTARFASGFPVTLSGNSDNSLLGTLGNGANNYLLDTPQYLPGPMKINTNGRSRRPAFNTAIFPEENLGQLGNARRCIFHGPGIENFDMTIEKDLRIFETRTIEFRAEAFNAFNHAQFYGPATVNGQGEDPNFGQIVS